YAMKAFELAECTVRRAIAVDPNNGSSYFLLAQIQKGLENYDAAIESARKAIALGYENGDVYVLLGDLHYQKMEISDSVEAMEKAISIDPQSAERIASFALAALTAENHPTLRSLLEKNAQDHPDSMNTAYALGIMYLREQDLPKAKQYFERLKKMSSPKS